jgi:hypothetical protein
MPHKTAWRQCMTRRMITQRIERLHQQLIGPFGPYKYGGPPARRIPIIKLSED